MSWLPDPVWPVVVLAAISLGDGLLCLRPAPFIARCFEDVGLPRRYWRLTPPIKFAAAAGLVAGIWVPGLAALTTACLVLYFVIAVAMHVHAHDYGRNLFVNAVGMLAICATTGAYCFVAA